MVRWPTTQGSEVLVSMANALTCEVTDAFSYNIVILVNASDFEKDD